MFVAQRLAPAHATHNSSPVETEATPVAQFSVSYLFKVCADIIHIRIRECGSTLYVGMAQGISFSLYIGIGAKFENTQKTGERRLRTAEYRTVLL